MLNTLITEHYSLGLHIFTTLTGEYRNFRICLCLEVGSKPQEAIAYCQKATSVCKERINRLTNEVKSLSESIPSASKSDNSITDKQAEIDTLTGLSSELERKVDSVHLKRYLISFMLLFGYQSGNLGNHAA